MRKLLLISLLLVSASSFAQLVPAFSWTGHCEGASTSFQDQSTTDNQIISYAWKINHVIQFSTSQTPSLTFPDTGCVDITLVVTDNNGTDSITQSVCIDPTPVLNCPGGQQSACVGEDYCTPCILRVGNTTVGGTVDWGDGLISAFPNPCHTYADCGTYTLSYTSVDGCPVSTTSSVTAYCGPVADFDATETGSLGVHFDDQSVITGNELVTVWNWAFGDATASGLPNPNHTYPDTGTYNVCFSTTSVHGCSDQICKPVQVSYIVPYFSWTGHCEGDQIQFTDESSPSGINAWTWKVDGQTFSTSQNPTYTFTDSGCYDITLIIGGLGENDSVTRTVCIDPTPEWVCDNSPMAVCLGNAFCLPCRFVIDGDTIDGDIDWGDGSPIANFNNPCHMYAACGTYNLSFTTSPNGCTAIANETVTVNCPPVADFTSEQTDLYTRAFSDASSIPAGSIVSWYWDFGDLTNSTEQNPIHVYSAPGNYVVCLIVVSDQGCSDTICQTVGVSQLTPDFSWNGHCEDDPIYFTDESVSGETITYWLWKVNGVGVSNDQDLVYTFPDSGCYSVSLTVTAGGETRTHTDTICLDQTPEMVCDNTPYAACIGDPVCISCNLILNGDTLDAIVNWGDGSTGPVDLCHVYGICGTYDIEISSNNPCPANSSTHSMQVTAYDLPNADYDITQDSLTITLYNQSTISCPANMSIWAIEWGDGSGEQSPISSPVNHTFDTAGTYTICMWVTTSQGCYDSICEPILISGVFVPEILENVNFTIYQQEGFLWVNIEGSDIPVMQFNLFNYSGQLVDATNLSNGNTIRFNTDALSKGLYVLQVIAEGRSVNRKVVIR